MTLKELKARTAAAYIEAAKVPNGLNSKPRFLRMNMREAWVANRNQITVFLQDPQAARVIDKRLVRFDDLGELYYHAKKHGMQAAMLLRLKRS